MKIKYIGNKNFPITERLTGNGYRFSGKGAVTEVRDEDAPKLLAFPLTFMQASAADTSKVKLSTGGVTEEELAAAKARAEQAQSQQNEPEEGQKEGLEEAGGVKTGEEKPVEEEQKVFPPIARMSVAQVREYALEVHGEIMPEDIKNVAPARAWLQNLEGAE